MYRFFTPFRMTRLRFVVILNGVKNLYESVINIIFMLLYYSQIKIAQRFFDCGFAFAQNDTFSLRCHPERSEVSFHFLFENSITI